MPFSIEYLEKLNKIFVHLHCHSDYSNIRLLDSINKIEDMVKYVNELGNTAMSLTDHECLSGSIKFLTIVQELKDEEIINKDFKPILGNEIYLVNEEQMNDEMQNLGRTTFYHYLLQSKDSIGHEQLRELSSRAWKRMFSYKGIERVPTFYSDIEEIIGQNRGHIIASSACLGGRLPRLILTLLQEENEDIQEQIKDEIDDFITWNLDIFGDDFYIELQPSLQQEQIDFNIMAIKIAKAYGLKWIISTDSHYLREEDRPIHNAFLTSEDDENNNREVDSFYSTTHFFTVEKIFENMNYLDAKDIESGILATKEIADKIIGYDFKHKQIIPKRKLPLINEWYRPSKNIQKFLENNNYDYINELFNSSEVFDRFLISSIFQGVDEKIKKEEYKETFDRINIECKEIIGSSKAKDEPMSSYFITMQKNIDIIWEEANSLVMPGRGSAGGFIIDYLLGITQINPLKQGIEMPHWRFISAERPDLTLLILFKKSYI